MSRHDSKPPAADGWRDMAWRKISLAYCCKLNMTLNLVRILEPSRPGYSWWEMWANCTSRQNDVSNYRKQTREERRWPYIIIQNRGFSCQVQGSNPPSHPKRLWRAIDCGYCKRCWDENHVLCRLHGKRDFRAFNVSPEFLARDR